MRKKVSVLAVIMFGLIAGLRAQVTVGELVAPSKGVLLDLDTSVKGGFTLSNVTLDNLYTIPSTFPGMTPPPANMDTVKSEFRGSIVYHTGTDDIPAGVYVWNGTNWTFAVENCLPLDTLTLTSSAVLVKEGESVTFSVSSGESERCAGSETYEWYQAASGSDYGSQPDDTTVYPHSSKSISFPSAGTYKVKVTASNPYADYDSVPKVSSNDVLVYVSGESAPPPLPALQDVKYGINGPACYDVNTIGDLTKTYTFTHTVDYSALTVSNPGGIIAAVSQPAPSGSGSGSAPIEITFVTDVQTRVKDAGAPIHVLLPVNFRNNEGELKIAYKRILLMDGICGCPAKIDDGKWLTFMCRNLGDTEEITFDADLAKIDSTNFHRYNGDWYRFGAKNASVVNTGDNIGDVSDWSNLPIDLVAREWPDSLDADIGNPCPSGWRLPTADEWRAVLNPANNTIKEYIGDSEKRPEQIWCVNDRNRSTCYNHVLKIGDYLYLPAAGYRTVGTGLQMARGASGTYWSSSTNISSFDPLGVWHFIFTDATHIVNYVRRTSGDTVRCVAAN